jgi:hemerythrin
MALIEWNNSLSVDIREIDEQHRTLVGFLNSLFDAMKAGKGKDVLGKVLSDLVKYTVFHFATEEKYFKTYAYPDFVKHKQEHEYLTKKAADLKGKFDRGEAVITVEVMQFLKDWLNGHILGADKKYSPFLRGKGLL